MSEDQFELHDENTRDIPEFVYINHGEKPSDQILYLDDKNPVLEQHFLLNTQEDIQDFEDCKDTNNIPIIKLGDLSREGHETVTELNGDICTTEYYIVDNEENLIGHEYSQATNFKLEEDNTENDYNMPDEPEYLCSEDFCVETTYDLKNEPKRIKSDSINLVVTQETNRRANLSFCVAVGETPIHHYLCKFCMFTAGCIYCLKTHYNNVHLKQNTEYACEKWHHIINKTLVCVKCKLISPTFEEQSKHFQSHYVTCEKCNITYKDNFFFWKHSREKHNSSEISLTCELCTDHFTDPENLLNHYQISHDMFLCIVCLTRYQSKMELDQHCKCHPIFSEAIVLPYACSKCDEAFAHISLLQRHVHVHRKKKRLYLPAPYYRPRINKKPPED